MKIGFCGQLYGKRMEESIGSHNTVSYAIRKFNRNFVDSLSCFSEVKVYSPVNERRISADEEIEGERNYRYLRYNGKLGRILLFLKSFFLTLIGNENVYFIDALNVSQAIGVVTAKKVKKKKAVSIITDIPQGIIDGRPGIYGKLFLFIIKKSDALVVLTEQTAIDYNLEHKPFTIIEGIANDIKGSNLKHDDKHICIYAGGLAEKYFVVQMAECFAKVANDDEYLYIFGDGESRVKISELAGMCPQIKYMGIVDNKKVIDYELQSILLINPRPNIGEYTKYSFPSKLIEYMSTGVAVLGNKLDGVPNEYNEYIYFFDGYTYDDYCSTIRKMLDKNVKELSTKGESARRFILKRNGIQATSNKLRDLLYEIEVK